MPDHSTLWLARNRRIWGLAHKINMAQEDLRDLVGQVTGNQGEHNISGLAEGQQIQVLGALQLLQVHIYRRRRAQKKRLDPKPKGSASNATTYRQIKELRRLAEELGWGDGALRAWLKKWWKVDHEKWLTASKATRAIQGMKAMLQRTQRMPGPPQATDQIAQGEGHGIGAV